MSGEDGLSGAEIAASVIGGLACLGLAVGGGCCLVKCLKWCLLSTPTPNTHNLEAPETPEEAAGPPQNPLKTIKALLEPVLRTKAKVQEEAMVDPVDSVDQMDQMDPLDQVDSKKCRLWYICSILPFWYEVIKAKKWFLENKKNNGKWEMV